MIKLRGKEIRETLLKFLITTLIKIFNIGIKGKIISGFINILVNYILFRVIIRIIIIHIIHIINIINIINMGYIIIKLWEMRKYLITIIEIIKIATLSNIVNTTIPIILRTITIQLRITLNNRLSPIETQHLTV
jgi:hypothetical protein